MISITQLIIIGVSWVFGIPLAIMLGQIVGNKENAKKLDNK